MTTEAAATEAPPVLDWFDAPTWGRRPNLDLIVSHLEARFPKGGGLLVEIGSLRTPGNVVGDGCASVAWADLAKRTGHLALSIDVDRWSVENANRLRRYGLPIFGIVGDGSEVLQALGSLPIHLLYLDGSDDAKEAIAQLVSAIDRMPSGAVVLVDDASQKGKIVAEFMAGACKDGLALKVEGLDGKWNQQGWVIA